MFVSLMTIISNSQNTFIMSVFFYVHLLLYVFIYLSCTMTTTTFQFISKSITAWTLLFFFYFTIEYLSFTATTDTSLWLFISTLRTVYFSCELYFFLCSHKCFLKVDTEGNINILTFFGFFIFFVRSIILIKSLEILPVLLKCSFGSFLRISFIRIVSFCIFTKRTWLRVNILIIGWITIIDNKIVSLSILIYDLPW